jgi:hypothetical protein
LILLLGVLTHESDDFIFLEQLIKFMRTMKDARTPPSTRNVHVACELALRLVKRVAETRAWTDKGVHPGNLFLSPLYFKPLEDAKLKALAASDATVLPTATSLPDIPSGPRGMLVLPTPSKKEPAAAAASTTKKKRATPPKSEKPAAKKEVAKTAKAPETPARQMPERGAKKNVTYDEDEEDEEEDEGTAPKSTPVEETTKPKPKAKAKAKRKIETDDQESESEEENSASKKRKAPSKKAKAPPKKKAKEESSEESSSDEAEAKPLKRKR